MNSVPQMPNGPAMSAVLRIVKYAVLVVVSILLVTMLSFRIQSYFFARKSNLFWNRWPS